MFNFFKIGVKKQKIESEDFSPQRTFTIENQQGEITPEDFSAQTNSTVKVLGENNFIEANLSSIKFVGSQLFEFIGNNNKIVIENGAVLSNCKIKFSGNSSIIVISKNCSVSINVHMSSNDGKIKIGEKTTMARVLMVCQENGSEINIGKDCMFSSEVFIRNSDSHSIIDIKTNKRINPPKNVFIDDHVWVGQSVKINKGVQIYANSIIANGSVVTGKVPPNCVFGGNPAKLIKRDVSWLRDLITDFE